MDIIKNPSLQFLLGFVIITAYIPGVFGASIPTGWLVLIILAPLIFLHRLPGLFLVYALLSLFWTPNFNISLLFFFQLVALACVFQFGERLSDQNLKSIFKGLAVGLVVSDIVALFFQSSVFSSVNTQAALFVNPNIFCEVSVVILIALLVLELYWWIPVTFPGIVLIHSRGALLALGICGFLLVWKKDRLFAIFGLMIVVAIGIYYLPDGNIASIHQRLDLWADTIRGLTLFGNGVGSYELLYPWNAVHVDTSLERPRFAHNDLLQLIFEYGLGVLFLVPIALKVFTSDNKHKIILYCVGIISLSTYPFHVPVLAFIGCLVAGYISFNNGSVRPSWNTWGPNLFKRAFTAKSFIFTSGKNRIPV